QTLSVCWARAASGHEAAPPSSVMKARRFIQRSRRRGRTDGKRAHALLNQLFEDRIEIMIAARTRDVKLQPQSLGCRLREARNGFGKGGHRRIDQKTDAGDRGQ